MNKKIIINADDCGKSVLVDEHIRDAMEKGLISSTTVMANMDDFEGALKLYKDFSPICSFGWHMNLTEGTPLLYSQMLLDYGYYKENDGKIEFNGRAFKKDILPKRIEKEIKKELISQYEKLRDSGINISHADSHQHIHTTLCMLKLLPSLINDLGITKLRRVRNYVPNSISYVARQIWGAYYSHFCPELKMVDSFGSYEEYINNPNLRTSSTIELMCHPGHQGESYKKEERLLLENRIGELNDIEIINYWQL